MERYFEIGNTLIKNGGVAWDNHNGGSEIRLHGLAALVLGDKVVTVGLLKADYFSLNRVFLQDDKVHLSVDSVGGTLFPVNFKDLWACIDDYNDKQLNNKFSCGTLENVMSLIPVPVTVITMTVAEFKAKSRARLDKAFNEAGGWEGLKAISKTDADSAPDAECVAVQETLIEAIGYKEVRHLISETEPGTWLREKLATDGTLSEAALLPPPRTQAEIGEMTALIATGLSPEEANKQFVSRRSGERVATLNELFEKGTKVVGTPTPEEANREAMMHRKVFGPVDFLPGDEDEIQEAYYREMLAKKQAGAEPTEDLGKDIPFVAGYAGHKDPTKL